MYRAPWATYPSKGIVPIVRRSLRFVAVALLPLLQVHGQAAGVSVSKHSRPSGSDASKTPLPLPLSVQLTGCTAAVNSVRQIAYSVRDGNQAVNHEERLIVRAVAPQETALMVLRYLQENSFEQASRAFESKGVT